jgi:hypothetical protein
MLPVRHCLSTSRLRGITGDYEYEINISMKIAEVLAADEPRLIEFYSNGRVFARLKDGSVPPFVYRVLSINEYQISMKRGFFQSRERMHAAIKPLLQFCEPGPVNALIRIAYSDDDGWQPKWMYDEVVVITSSPVPSSKIELIAAGTRDDLALGPKS